MFAHMPFLPGLALLATLVASTLSAEGETSAVPKPPAEPMSRPSPSELPRRIYLIEEMRVTQPWTQPTNGASTEANGYLTIENRGPSPDRLTGAKVDVADRVILVSLGSQTPPADGSNSMTIPPEGKLDLEPGSAHLTLLGLHHPLKDGDRFGGVLDFERAGPLPVEFVVEDQPRPPD